MNTPTLVLVVEDDRAIREMLRMALETEGYTVWTLDNGMHVTEALRTADRPCVVLLDLMMPLVTGWDVLHQIAQDPTLARHAVIAMTAGMMKGELPPPGALVLLAKPFLIDDVYALVEQFAASFAKRASAVPA